MIKEPSSHATQNHTDGIEAVLGRRPITAELERPIEQKRTILVVDDNEDLREILRIVLEYEGFRVMTAEDGIGGLNIAITEKPDLLVVDFNMPRLNGDELIRLLRERAEFCTTPILVITAYGQRAAEPAFRAGADRLMTKPLDSDQVVESIRELLARSSAASSPI